MLLVPLRISWPYRFESEDGSYRARVALDNALTFAHISYSSCSTRKLDPPFLQLCLLKQLLPAILAVVFVVSLLVFSIPGFRSIRKSTRHLLRQHTALKSLSHVVTPTSSFWRADYLGIARKATASSVNRVGLPLGTLANTILAGQIELRDAPLHLPALIVEAVTIDGWEIQLRVGVFWWIRVCAWLFAAQFESPNPAPYTEDAAYNRETPKQDLRDKSMPAAMRRGFCLDTVPFPHLETALRAFQSSAVPGTDLVVEFTARSSSVSFLSTAYILTAFPYLPRRHVRMGRKASQKNGFIPSRTPPYASASRTMSPLSSSLSYILALLVSGTTPFTIHSVRNVSQERANSLYARLHALEEDPSVRATFVDDWGMDGWREERFYTAWEASLLSTAYLERWRIIVQKTN